MLEELQNFITKLKSNPRIRTYDEAATKQAIILPMLQILDWNIQDVDEVCPEYSVEARRVDYALRLNNSNEVFMEVKKSGEDLEKHQEQLLEYSFRQGVELATLTNGVTWLFYLPTKKGDWSARKFYAIDILEQEVKVAAKRFADILSKQNVQNGEAVRRAEAIYRGRMKKRAIEDTFPEAWNKIVTEPDSLLIDLVAEVTEKLCGFKPEIDDVKNFLKTYEDKFLVRPHLVSIQSHKPIDQRKQRPPSTLLPTEKTITQDDLIPHIINVLRKYEGRARKAEVEKEIYQQFEEIFQQPYYQELVSNGVPRWQHNLAWAKERAKKKGLIKTPDESGRGYWELR